MAAALLASTAAHAVQYGSPQLNSVLGEPLRLVVPVRVAAGQTLPPQCARVTIKAGQRVLDDVILQRVVSQPGESGEYSIWVRSSVPMTHPDLSLLLACSGGQLALHLPAANGALGTESAAAPTGSRPAPEKHDMVAHTDSVSGRGVVRALASAEPADAQPSVTRVALGEREWLMESSWVSPERSGAHSKGWQISSVGTVLQWAWDTLTIGANPAAGLSPIQTAQQRRLLEQLQALQIEQQAMQPEIQRALLTTVQQEQAFGAQLTLLTLSGLAALLAGVGLWWTLARAQGGRRWRALQARLAQVQPWLAERAKGLTQKPSAGTSA
ncbi:hypothetical protein ACG0Z6_02325 [Roseateles sp. BYS180W]|uniref:Protein BatD n=1 Tax=Roseateles rivi TaxID=3299028 RepID=A0ABW7FRV9_9BURK